MLRFQKEKPTQSDILLLSILLLSLNILALRDNTENRALSITKTRLYNLDPL